MASILTPPHPTPPLLPIRLSAAIGEMELDQILRARAELNTIIRTSVQEAASAWGLEIKRCGHCPVCRVLCAV